MTTRPPLAICPVVAEMTAGGSFNLDDLKAHVRDCPICRPIVQALLPIAQEAVTPVRLSAHDEAWPTPTRFWRVELAADAATNPAPDLAGAIEAARRQARTHPAR